MYKVCFLIKSGQDPFRYQGIEAAEQVLKCFNGIKGYVQTRALPGDEEPAFSGVAECWFEHASDAIDACGADIAPMLNSGAAVLSVYAGLERVVLRAVNYQTNGRVKGVYPFRRRPDLTIDQFRHHWWHTHGPIAALTDDALSYHQIHPVEAISEAVSLDYDGITEITWPDAGLAGKALASRQMREDQGADAPNFVDMDSIALVLAAEEMVITP